MTQSGFLNPSSLRFYECNSMGMMCEEIYSPNENYYNWRDEYDFALEVIDDTRIIILVNDEEVYQHRVD